MLNTNLNQAVTKTLYAHEREKLLPNKEHLTNCNQRNPMIYQTKW